VSLLSRSYQFVLFLKFRKKDLSNKLFQDGEVDGTEFAAAVKKNCMNKPFAELPSAFKAFIHEAFKSIDVDGNFNRKMPKTPKRRLICITERVQNRYLPFFDISVSIINSLLWTPKHPFPAIRHNCPDLHSLAASSAPKCPTTYFIFILSVPSVFKTFVNTTLTLSKLHVLLHEVGPTKSSKRTNKQTITDAIIF